MADSFVRYTASGSTDTFSITFGYLDPDHVSVALDGVDTAFTFPSASQVQITSGNPSAGVVVEVRRTTPRDSREVVWSNASNLTASDLNTSDLQFLYITQEAFDVANDALLKDATGVFDATSLRIQNVATPTSGGDAANKTYVDAVGAAVSADAAAAAVSAGNAATSESNASDSETAAASSESNAAASASTATTQAGIATTKASEAAASAADAIVAKMEWQNAYNAGTAYEINDVVSYLGSSVICIQAGTGQTPDPDGDTAYWELVAQRGEDGDITGPVSSTDNAIMRWDGTSGATAQNSGVTIDDSDNISGINILTADRASVGGDTTIDSGATNLQVSYVPSGDFTPATNTAYEALVFKGNNNGYAGMRISAPNSGNQQCAIAFGDEASAISGLMGYLHSTDTFFFGHGFTNWLTASSSLIQFSNSGSEAMRIDGGKVGIGETSPDSKLHLGGTASFVTMAELGADPTTPGTGEWGLYAKSDGIYQIDDAGTATALSGGATITEWVGYTPTFTAFGTVSSVEFFSRRVGDSLEVRGRFVSGTPTATEARISLGFNGTEGSVSMDSAKQSASNVLAGIIGSNTNNLASLFILAKGSDGYVTIGLSTSSYNALTSYNGDDVASSGRVFSIEFLVPIDGWS